MRAISGWKHRLFTWTRITLSLKISHLTTTTYKADPLELRINGRAAAIECYLDVGPRATVRWNNYHKDLGVYHGELVDKADAMKTFLAQSEVNGSYDLSGIAAVVDIIVSECTAMRESARLADLAVS